MRTSTRIIIAVFLALMPFVAGAQQKDINNDWPRYSYYAEQNTLVKNKPVAVLFGDSITRNWVRNDSAWLKGQGFVGRGIGGQTTMHMLARFRPDVIDLDPEYVVILAGINDIARNNGFILVGNIFKNLVSMVELAQVHGIKPVMCTLTPASEIGWRKEVGDPRPSIDSLNTMIRSYAAANGIPLADYHTAMKTEDGAMKAEFLTDAVHPNLAGYKVMEEVLLATLGASISQGEAVILTPPAPKEPRINGPKVYGVRPGSPVLYRIPATGERPMSFSAKGLPRGLKLDPSTGIITGKVCKAGTWDVTLVAENSLGRGERIWKLKVGEDICLTPPLGWNSWNVWGNSVTQDQVLRAAKAMVSSGLADCGWTYVNIDDGWQGVRGGKFLGIQPNSKFPDMKALADSVHALGLKIGIYSGPWVSTYAGHIGSSADHPDGTVDFVLNGQVDSVYKFDRSKYDRKSVRYFGDYSFAAADARQWAAWGIDYLKYDWYPNDVPHAREMSEALKSTGRDIVLSLSNRAPLSQGAYWEELSHAWRTTDDIRDNWASVRTIGFGGHPVWAPFCGPGSWPDADMMVVGKVGWGPKVHQTGLTPDEQYTHISLWALLASPLLLGCDLEQLDPFTLGLLTNTEVLDVNQDPLGKMATIVDQGDGYAVFMKVCEDGAAVGLFNLSEKPRNVGFSPRSIGFTGEVAVRDLWRQADLAPIQKDASWSVLVPAHGVVLIKLSTPNIIQ